jgi:holliday junction DNA helicase RuvA
VIGSVRGTVIERTTTGDVLIEVGGVGYRVQTPLSLIPALEVGANTFLFVHTHVREDAIVLYGFASRDERETFDALIGANGVGPKLALAILSVHAPSSLRRCLANDDLDGLVVVPGVGKRTAQRLMIELKSRLEVPDLDLAAVPGGAASTARAEVRDALSGLGYSTDEVRDVLGELPEDGSVEDLLRDALRLLAGSR